MSRPCTRCWGTGEEPTAITTYGPVCQWCHGRGFDNAGWIFIPCDVTS